MYYHVLVEFYERNKTSTKKEYLLDLNDTNSIIEDILKPFKLDKEIIINGRFLKKSEIAKIRVVSTKESSSDLYAYGLEKEDSGILSFATPYTEAFSKDNCTDLTTALLHSINDDNNTIQMNNISSHLHKRIADVSLKKYLDGYYSDAVESAIKDINSRLKKLYMKFKQKELDGSQLFAQVFNDDENKALLKVADLSTQSGKDEQKGYQLMFMGMWSALRNPKAHDNLSMTEDEAYDRLIFLSMLMKKIDQALQNTFEE